MWPQENHYVWNDTDSTAENRQEDAPVIDAALEESSNVPYVMLPLAPSFIDRSAMIRASRENLELRTNLPRQVEAPVIDARLGSRPYSVYVSDPTAMAGASHENPESHTNRLGQGEEPVIDPRYNGDHQIPYFLSPTVVSVPEYFSIYPDYVPRAYRGPPDAPPMQLPLPQFAFDLRVASRRGPRTPPEISSTDSPRSPSPNSRSHGSGAPGGTTQRRARGSCSAGVPGPSHEFRRSWDVPGPSHEFRRSWDVPGPSHGNEPRRHASGPSREFRRSGDEPGPSHGNAPGPSHGSAPRRHAPGPSREVCRSNGEPGPSHGNAPRNRAPAPPQPHESHRSGDVPTAAPRDKPREHAPRSADTPGPPRKTRRRNPPPDARVTMNPREAHVTMNPSLYIRHHGASESPIDLTAIERSSTQPLQHGASSSSRHHRDEPTAPTAAAHHHGSQPPPTKFQHSENSAFRKFEPRRGTDSTGPKT